MAQILESNKRQWLYLWGDKRMSCENYVHMDIDDMSRENNGILLAIIAKYGFPISQ